MTTEQFDHRLKEIEEQYAQRRVGAEAFRDQEVGRLFVECGWTQEKIGKRMGQAQSWVARRLLLGRFLNYAHGHNSSSPPDSLTERRFRDAWATSGKRKKESEDERFARVAVLLRDRPPELPKGYQNLVRKPGIKQAVIEVCSDGKRRTTAEIAELVSEKIPDTDGKQIIQAIKHIQQKPPAGMALDARHTGRSHKYRLVPRKKADTPCVVIDPERASAMALEVLPLVEESLRELKKPEVSRAISVVMQHLWKIEQAIRALLVPEEVV